MSFKKIILGYPTVSKFLDFVKKKDYMRTDKLTTCLNDYFNSNVSTIRPNISSTDFNILVLNTASKQISSEVSNVVGEYEKNFGKINKQIKVFIIEHNYAMEVIGRFPFVIALLDRDIIDGIFEIIICQCELLNSPIIPHLKDFIKEDGLLICDKRIRLNVDEIQGWSKVRMSNLFHTFQPVMSDRSDLSFDINDSDIQLDDFLKYQSGTNLEIIRIDEYVRNFIHNYVERTGHKIRLLRNSFNILVMCSNTPSINRQKYLSILQRCTGSNIEMGDSIVYHIGKDIYAESNVIFRGIIERLEILNEIKFDLIISEHCPTVSLIGSLGHIKRLLKDDGALITPVTSFEKKMPYGFDLSESLSEDYMILIKNYSSSSDESTALSSRSDNRDVKADFTDNESISSITVEDSLISFAESKTSDRDLKTSYDRDYKKDSKHTTGESYESYDGFDENYSLSFNKRNKSSNRHRK